MKKAPRLGSATPAKSSRSGWTPLAESIGADFVEECDLTDDAAIDDLFRKGSTTHLAALDFIVHSVAFAPRDDLTCRFVDTSRQGFRVAMDVSCYT